MAQTIPGTLSVSNGCIADLAGYAALECYGVVGMAEVDAASGVPSLLPGPRLRRGVDVGANEDGLTVDLHVIVDRDVNLASVAQNLTSSVKYLLKEIAQLSDVDVRVHVEGIRQN